MATEPDSTNSTTEKYLSLYDDAFYEQAIAWQGPCAFNVAKAIADHFRPMTLIDVGCGPGTYLIQWRLLGINVSGLEGSPAGIERCKRQGLSVQQVDLSRPYYSKQKFDLAISFEVAEHLPPIASLAFVKTLTHLAPDIVFTAAQPGQGGTGHINEQPLTFWDTLFAKYNFEVDYDSMASLVEVFGNCPLLNPWLLSNLRVYRTMVRPAGSNRS